MKLQNKLVKCIDNKEFQLKETILMTLVNFLVKLNSLSPEYIELIELFPIYNDCVQLELTVGKLYIEIEIFENVQNIYIENIMNDKSDDFDLSVSGDNLAYVVFSLIKMYELLIDWLL